MKVLLTGAFGIVGINALQALIKQHYEVRIFDKCTPANKRRARPFRTQVEIRWGDILNIADVGEAVKGCDVVIHLAAIIPPLADCKPQFAAYVNVGGTENLIQAIKRAGQATKIIYTSSIAVYGDRVHTPLIKNSDPPQPLAHDHYAQQKLQSEQLIRDSGLEWAIFRLTYIVSTEKLQLHPIMFDMPLATSIEICDTKDVGLALANAVANREIIGKTLPIAGGTRCRIQYGAYLDKMLALFGIGKKFLPEKAFSKGDFHCGFMETEESQQYLHFHQHTLYDYFGEVYKKYRVKRFFLSLIRPLAQLYLLSKSPYLRALSGGAKG